MALPQMVYVYRIRNGNFYYPVLASPQTPAV